MWIKTINLYKLKLMNNHERFALEIKTRIRNKKFF